MYPSPLQKTGTAELWCIVDLTAILHLLNLYFSLIWNFYCCLVKKSNGEPWYMLSNLSSDRLAAYKPIPYKTNECNLNMLLRFLWLHFFYLISLFQFILRSYILTQNGWKVYFMIWYLVKYNNIWLPDHLTKNWVISLKEFTVDSKNYLHWKLGIEFEIALNYACELNFDKSFLHFNVKKKIYAKVILNLTVYKYWILDTASLNSWFIGS